MQTITLKIPLDDGGVPVASFEPSISDELLAVLRRDMDSIVDIVRHPPYPRPAVAAARIGRR